MQSERRLLEVRIERLVNLVQKEMDDELRAELTKYLCVLASGLIEVTCRDILNKFAAKQCAPAIQRFVAANLADFQNVKVGKLQELLARFDPIRAERWRLGLTDEEADAVDSIVNNRHQIAHGRSIGLSFDVFRRYHRSATKALERLEKQFPSY